MKNLIIIVLTLLLGTCNNGDDITIPNENIYKSSLIAYNQVSGVDPNLLSLDIYYNSITSIKKPIVIYVHGGGWSIGDKKSQLENKVNLFKSLNYVFVSINYRLSPFPYELNDPNRILYPTHNNDVVDAIKWVYDNIDQYGGDSNKIVLLGHSAGAHLISLTGTNNIFLENVGLNFSNIKGIAAIDTEGYNVISKIEDNDNLYINAFGTNANSNIEASPILNIENGTPYPKFFIAKRGNTERVSIANQFINSLETNGNIVFQVDGNTFTHVGINNAIGAPNETIITEPLKNFFMQCFE